MALRFASAVGCTIGRLRLRREVRAVRTAQTPPGRALSPARPRFVIAPSP